MILAEKYSLIKQIGNGSYGYVFQGENIRTKQPVAIKMEIKEHDINMIKREAQIYQYLAPKKGIPQVKYYGTNDKYNFMVLPLLGDSLKQPVAECRGERPITFSLDEVLTIGKNMIDIIEYVHSKKLIHRDLKPENFLFGLDPGKTLHLIDFGFCKKYIDKYDNHIMCNNGKTMVGSINYASINIHNGLEASRRDDMESIVYILLFLLNGNVPWNNLPISAVKERKMRILYDTNTNPIISRLFILCRNLNFNETPNYNLFKKGLKNDC
jgi:serine/threonine protein kinase